MSEYKIYYFPYAGASAATFKKWGRAFQDLVEFTAFDYGGHGEKNSEAFPESIDEVCEELYELILEDNEEELPYALAGHCLGGIIACELYYKIQERGEMPLPERIFVSGHGAPDKLFDEGLLDMNEDEILMYFNKLGVIKDSMLEGEARKFTQGLYIPPIKADAKLYLNYEWNLQRNKIEVPLTIQYGNRDKKCPIEEVKRWADFTTEPIHFLEYDAEHYFILEQMEQVVADMKADIKL